MVEEGKKPPGFQRVPKLQAFDYRHECWAVSRSCCLVLMVSSFSSSIPPPPSLLCLFWVFDSNQIYSQLGAPTNDFAWPVLEYINYFGTAMFNSTDQVEQKGGGENPREREREREREKERGGRK